MGTAIAAGLSALGGSGAAAGATAAGAAAGAAGTGFGAGLASLGGLGTVGAGAGTVVGATSAGIGLGTIGTALNVASTGLGALSSIQQGQAQAARAETQAQLQRRNQKIAQQRAEDRRELGEIEADRRRRQADLQIGTQKSTLAGRGVRIDTGTPQDVFEGTAEFGELDALTLRNNAERDALRFEQQGAQAGIQSNLFDARADSARTQGRIGAATSVVGGTAGIFEDRQKLRQRPPRQTGGSIFDS